MCAARNYHRIAVSLTSFVPVTVEPAAANLVTNSATLNGPDPPTPTQVMGNQTQLATDVLQVTEELQGLTLNSSVQGIDFGVYLAAAPVPMFVAQGEVQDGDRMTLLLDVHHPSDIV